MPRLTVISAALLLLLSAPAFAATPANLVANPSCTTGSTTGWGVWSGTALSCVQQNGQWWLDWKVSNAAGGPVAGQGWSPYTLPSTLTVGQSVTCGAQVMGSGQIFMDIQTGNGDVDTSAVMLESTPQTVRETATIQNKPGGGYLYPPQVMLRFGYQAGSSGSRNQVGALNILFNDVTCVVGQSVQLASQSTTATAGTVASSGTSHASGSLGSGSASQKAKATLPKAGMGLEVRLAALALTVAAGSAVWLLGKRAHRVT